jgi:hypothetical protein
MAENEQTKICPKCGKALVEGFILERGHGNGKSVSSWVAGKPEKSLWTGLQIGDRMVCQIASFRCTGCGFLESYAQE